MTTGTATIELPRKLSDLLELAICDGRSKLDRSVYLPDYLRWHDPGQYPENRQCKVCLAGAVIAGTLARNFHTPLMPADFDTGTCDALLALEDARIGRWLIALEYLDQAADVPPEVKDILLHLDAPKHADFEGWPEFALFLDSLEDRVTSLRALGL